MNWNELGAWSELLADQKDFFSELQERLSLARQTAEIYPPDGAELTALRLTQPEAVRAVILGQDPYHEPGQAFGLAFAVRKGIPLPPSLRNIYTELQADVGVAPPQHGDLTVWTERGVLLLNTVLTVEKGKANSHANWGWQKLTDAVIAATNRLPQPVAFVLWGAQAQKKAALIDSAAPRLVLSAPHPSPLSSYRGFFGSRPFSQINRFLADNGEPPIDWKITSEY